MTMSIDARLAAIEAKLTGATEGEPAASADGPWAALDRVLTDIETRLAAVERRTQTTEP